MKRLFLFASLFLFTTTSMFFSCEETQDIIGNMDITIDGKEAKIPSAYFQFTGETTTITAVGVGHNVSIHFRGKTPGTYTLGFGQDATSAVREAIAKGFENPENILIYKPVLNLETGDIMTSMFGTIKITESSSSSLKGSFEATVADFDKLRNLNLAGIIDILNGESSSRIKGTFNAVSITNK